jgi:hypothetical protein
MFVIEFPLLTTKEDEAKLNKIFKDLTVFYNKMVKKYVKRIYELEKVKLYQEIKKELCFTDRKKEIRELLKDENISEEEKVELNAELLDIKSKNQIEPQRKKELETKRKEILKKFLLNGEYDVYGYVKPKEDYSTKLRKFISKNNPYLHTNFFYSSCKNLWSSIEKRLYGNGKKLHYKNNVDRIESFCGKNNSADGTLSGIKFNTENFITTIGNGRHTFSIKTKVDTNITYNLESIKLPNIIKFGKIVRKKIREKDKFFLQLTIDGKIPQKKNRYLGVGKVGLDIGTQTVATVSDYDVKLVELADRVDIEERKIKNLQRKMDRSRRKNNKHFFNEKGQIIDMTKNNKKYFLENGLIKVITYKKSDKEKIIRLWSNSKNYIKLRNEVAELKRKQASIRKLQHNELTNQILKEGNEFYIEDMNFKALTKRSKETTVNEKTGKFNSKKRFGKSIANKAPAMFMTLLSNKVEALGGTYQKIHTKKCKASQYNHFEETNEKKKLGDRWNKFINGDKVQRDLYSAFLIQNVNQDLESYNNEQLDKKYPKFKSLHDKEINNLKNNGKKLLSSFGI